MSTFVSLIRPAFICSCPTCLLRSLRDFFAVLFGHLIVTILKYIKLSNQNFNQDQTFNYPISSYKNENNGNHYTDQENLLIKLAIDSGKNWTYLRQVLKRDIKNYKINFVIKGDQKIPSISAASIIAKVTRDKTISNLGKSFKNYHWGKNYGYGTKQHLKAIKKFGITTHHRKTFSPINKIR